MTVLCGDDLAQGFLRVESVLVRDAPLDRHIVQRREHFKLGGSPGVLIQRVCVVSEQSIVAGQPDPLQEEMPDRADHRTTNCPGEGPMVRNGGQSAEVVVGSGVDPPLPPVVSREANQPRQ
ncbi:hypothetical protein BS329_41060 [Amycolatopsis coloradensis]|uniref:Uncharacterized protein n=1 Tax=Amycolatopsis coloradensis TaxID=76021 RepID=A0A1R0KD74_9PSEU|nr:hypothetical protein BS329_41060 [Amycolatopsis coloradensis]